MSKINFNKTIIFFTALTITSIPYLFIVLPGINYSLLDLLIIILGLLTIISRKRIRLNKSNILFYSSSCIFIVFSVLPFFTSSSITYSVTALFQYLFILFWLFPTISSALNIKLYSQSLMFMGRTWSIFLIFNSFHLNNSEMFLAGRYAGFYSNPGTLGTLIAVMFPILLYLLTIEEKKLNKILILVGIIISLVLLLATGSRAGLIGLIIGTVIYFILKYNFSKKIISRALLVTALIIVTFSIFISDFERNPLDRLFLNENTEVRINDTEIGLTVLGENLFIGTGLQNSAPTMAQYGGEFRPHNFFIAYLVETGLIGTIAIVLIISLCLAPFFPMIYNVVINRKIVNDVVAATFSSGIILIIISQFSTPSAHRGFWIFWALCLWIGTQHSSIIYKNFEKRI